MGANPIRDEARFRFELPEAARARLELFDLAGRRLAGSIEQALPAGSHEVSWPVRDLAPGIYVARLRAADRSEALRLVRIR